MGEVLGGALTGDSMVLLGDLNTHTGRPEPERCSVVGLLCKAQVVHTEHHVGAQVSIGGRGTGTL